MWVSDDFKWLWHESLFKYLRSYLTAQKQCSNIKKMQNTEDKDSLIELPVVKKMPLELQSVSLCL